MNNLDIKSLSLIFQFLELNDLVNCYQVCQKWNKLIKPKDLFLCYGTKYFSDKNSTNNFFLDKKISLIPYDVFDNSVYFVMESQFLKNIRSFIYFGCGYFVPSDSFSFYYFSQLKYLEIMDFKFCCAIIDKFKKHIEEKKINNNTSWKYFNSSIETLIIEYIDFSMLLTNLANIKNIEINEIRNCIQVPELLNEFKKTKWISFTLKKDTVFYGQKFNKEFILNFLSNECSALKSLGINIKSPKHLDKLLSISKIKKVCIKINLNELKKPIDYKNVILKHEGRIRKNCSLFINNFSIKSLDDFENLLKDENLLKSLYIFFNSLYDQNLKSYEINDCSEIQVFENYPYLDYIEKLSINEKYKNPKINFNKLFKCVPKTLKSLSISSFEIEDQNFTSQIPQYFPYLEHISILNYKKKNMEKIKHKCNFISDLKYLKSLMLFDLNLNSEELSNSIEKLFFLNYITIDVEKKIFDKFKLVLMNFFRKKKLSFIFTLRLNGINIISNNLSEVVEKNKKMKLF